MKVENPTSRDIADIAGVSQATVSRALRNSPLVRLETRQRIQQIAKDLNYFVNRNAAGLRTHHSNTLALLLFDETGGEEAEINPFFLSMLGQITREAARRGYDVLVSLQQLHDDWHIEYQASHRADGLILLGYGDYRTYREKLQALVAANTRFIIFGPKVASYPGYAIGCDNESGGEQATSHLLSMGRRRIAFLGNTTRRCPEYADRYAGYVRAHERAGVEPVANLKTDADNIERLGVEGVNRLLQSGEQFDAIFAVTDVIAIGAIKALHENGLSVPGDVSVVGFDDLPLAAHVAPALTTVRQDTRLASKRLVAAIVGQIEDEAASLDQLQPRLIIRESCGASN